MTSEWNDNRDNALSLQLSCPTSTMGKKSRVKTQKSGSGATAVVSSKEMMNFISELLQSMFTFTLYSTPSPALKF